MADKVVTIQLEGFAELEEKLYNLPSQLAKKGLRKALRAAGAIWRDEIQHNSKRLTGWMASQVDMTTSLSARNESGTVNVGFRKKQDPARVGKARTTPNAANEALWYELGTTNAGKPPHNQPARPFIRPAFQSKKEAVIQKFGDVLSEELDNLTK